MMKTNYGDTINNLLFNKQYVILYIRSKLYKTNILKGKSRMKKIRLDFKYCERGRFYRTLLVKENINLIDLGCAIVTAFNGAFVVMTAQ